MLPAFHQVRLRRPKKVRYFKQEKRHKVLRTLALKPNYFTSSVNKKVTNLRELFSSSGYFSSSGLNQRPQLCMDFLNWTPGRNQHVGFSSGASDGFPAQKVLQTWNLRCPAVKCVVPHYSFAKLE